MQIPIFMSRQSVDCMTSSTTTYFILCTFLLCLLSSDFCAANEAIKISDKIQKTIISPRKVFEMGFFSPPGKISENRRYLGIWYCMDPTTIVWVANRDSPLPDSSGVLVITDYGYLRLKDKKDKSFFSIELESQEPVLNLLDTGNAVLMDNQTGNILWQSFADPTDTFLPGMKMENNIILTSWKSRDNPAPGTFSFQEHLDGDYRYVIRKESVPSTKIEYWKGGSANSFNPTQIFQPVISLLSNVSLPTLKNSRLVMNLTGEIQLFSWNENNTNWDLLWSEPKYNCSVRNACGPFSSCNTSESSSKNLMCKCLPGFEAITPENPGSADSLPGVFSDGCKRTSGICSNTPEHVDEFVTLRIMKVGSTKLVFNKESEKECKEKCLEKCECQAYSYCAGDNVSQNKRRRRDTKRCWIWNSDLHDLQEGSGCALSIRIGNSTGITKAPLAGFGPKPEPNSSALKPVAIFALIALVVLLLCGVGYIVYRMMVNRRPEHIQRSQRNLVIQLTDSERRVQDFLDLDHSSKDDTEGIDVPFFELESILAATDDFSDANKLGQGGFGPVYKGKLPKGLEIAVKRLSSLSGQGLEEFKNEVVLIAKLQHRNLVRLLGYCMNGNEKMLLYEYMPNKSLDAFIFDRKLSMSLDWTKRFNIILGIARGLLYLHQDSRLRIIHRDLKSSNILLDEDMNPKISDFGLAKIVKGKDMEASTNRVIGTYGYMSPEYALDGLFSTKSDVFSFGVVVLEIISGKKNIGFYQSQSLLGYAWNLWKENKPFELMDQTLVESCNLNEVRKCIIVALLCVQEDPIDRPTMTNVVWTLSNETTSSPSPKQPAFVARKGLSSASSSCYKPETQTNNELTFSTEEGR